MGLGDLAFLAVLGLAMVAVFLSGRFAYREGVLLETAKSNAQAFVKWTEAVAAAGEKGEAITLVQCSAMPGEALEPTDAVMPESAVVWATCKEALFSAGGPLSVLSNPFDNNNTVAGNKCERRNPATRGLVYLEKGTMPPPGMPGGVSWGTLGDDEPVVRGLILRVQVCDAGGYPIKIAEAKL